MLYHEALQPLESNHNLIPIRSPKCCPVAKKNHSSPRGCSKRFSGSGLFKTCGRVSASLPFSFINIFDVVPEDLYFPVLTIIK